MTSARSTSAVHSIWPSASTCSSTSIPTSWTSSSRRSSPRSATSGLLFVNVPAFGRRRRVRGGVPDVPPRVARRRPTSAPCSGTCRSTSPDTPRTDTSCGRRPTGGSTGSSVRACGGRSRWSARCTTATTGTSSRAHRRASRSTSSRKARRRDLAGLAERIAASRHACARATAGRPRRRADIVSGLEGSVACAAGERRRRGPADPAPARRSDLLRPRTRPARAGAGRDPDVRRHGLYPPGHFYSPIPDLDAVKRDASRIFIRPDDVAGIDLRTDAQRARLETHRGALERCTRTTATPIRGCGIEPANDYFGHMDGLVLFGMLDDARAAAIRRDRFGLELGARARHARTVLRSATIECTFIEPYTDRLNGLLKPEDRDP